MKSTNFNIKEFVSTLTEVKREFDIGDNVAIFYKESYLPIKINGVVETRLKYFKGSFCIYDVYEESKTPYEYDIEVEILALEEYSDSPYSIFINAVGAVEVFGFEDVVTIEIGDIFILHLHNNCISHYEIKGAKRCKI